MSFAYLLSERAHASLRKMDIWLQEETLDELDRLTKESVFSGRRVGDALVRDFARDRGSQRFYVFIRFFPDRSSNALNVSDIGWCVLPHQRS